MPTPGTITDPAPVGWDHVTIWPDGRTLTVSFWNGAEGCFGLDRVEVTDTGAGIAVTPYVGLPGGRDQPALHRGDAAVLHGRGAAGTDPGRWRPGHRGVGLIPSGRTDRTRCTAHGGRAPAVGRGDAGSGRRHRLRPLHRWRHRLLRPGPGGHAGPGRPAAHRPVLRAARRSGRWPDGVRLDGRLLLDAGHPARARSCWAVPPEPGQGSKEDSGSSPVPPFAPAAPGPGWHRRWGSDRSRP